MMTRALESSWHRATNASHPHQLREVGLHPSAGPDANASAESEGGAAASATASPRVGGAAETTAEPDKKPIVQARKGQRKARASTKHGKARRIEVSSIGRHLPFFLLGTEPH